MKRRYVLLSREGLRAAGAPWRDTLLRLAAGLGAAICAGVDGAGGVPMQVLDSIGEDGPRLVELDRGAADRLNAAGSPFRALASHDFARPDPRPLPFAAPGGADARGARGWAIVTCTDAGSGAPVRDATVVGFTDFDRRIGARDETDVLGRAYLPLGGAAIERLYVYPTGGHWGALRTDLAIAGPIAVRLRPAEPLFEDLAQHYAGRFRAGSGVTVGLVGAGVGPHADLNLAGGANAVVGEPAGAYSDEEGHDTSIAGVIGARGAPPRGLRGVAPGVALRAYRVFAPGRPATSYAVLKAAMLAARDGCDVLHLRLAGAPWDEVVRAALEDAREHGMRVVIEPDDGAPGRADWFEAADPGAGTLSTLPGNRFGPISGLAIGSAVDAGLAACALSRSAEVLAMRRERERADAIERLLRRADAGTTVAADAASEDYGLPDPAAA